MEKFENVEGLKRGNSNEKEAANLLNFDHNHLLQAFKGKKKRRRGKTRPRFEMVCTVGEDPFFGRRGTVLAMQKEL